MTDFKVRIRPIHQFSQNPDTQLPPLGVTIRIISGIHVLSTTPSTSIRISNETFLAIPVTEWNTTGCIATLHAFDVNNPSVDFVCHPNEILGNGFIFEITPLTNLSQLYWIEFPPADRNARGIVIHTNLREIFRRTERFAIDFCNQNSRPESQYFQALPSIDSVISNQSQPSDSINNEPQLNIAHLEQGIEAIRDLRIDNNNGTTAENFHPSEGSLERH